MIASAKKGGANTKKASTLFRNVYSGLANNRRFSWMKQKPRVKTGNAHSLPIWRACVTGGIVAHWLLSGAG
jgi:hypothetical protein